MSDDAYKQPQRRWYAQPLLYASIFVLSTATMYATLQSARYFTPVHESEITRQESDWLQRRVRGATKRIDKAKKAFQSLLSGDEIGNAEPSKQSLDARITNP